MMHHDCLHHPSGSGASQLQRGKNRGPASTSNNASHIAYLETHPYKPIVPEEMEQVTHAGSRDGRRGLREECIPSVTSQCPTHCHVSTRIEIGCIQTYLEVTFSRIVLIGQIRPHELQKQVK